MRSTTYGTGQFGHHSGTQSTTNTFIMSLIGKWRQYRLLRDAESVPYSVMKDIGFRSAEQANAK